MSDTIPMPDGCEPDKPTPPDTPRAGFGVLHIPEDVYVKNFGSAALGDGHGRPLETQTWDEWARKNSDPRT